MSTQELEYASHVERFCLLKIRYQICTRIHKGSVLLKLIFCRILGKIKVKIPNYFNSLLSGVFRSFTVLKKHTCNAVIEFFSDKCLWNHHYCHILLLTPVSQYVLRSTSFYFSPEKMRAYHILLLNS